MTPSEAENPDEFEPDPAPETTPEARARIRKAPNAFRTISEVADDLHIPQHVLRFWETKFPQVKPLKRGGGRRYYRPVDITLLRRISGLLYVQGYTIKGVQRLLREGGGHLSDDIPPPAPDEKADHPQAEHPQAEHEAAGLEEAQLPMPGLVAPNLAASNPVSQGVVPMDMSPPRPTTKQHLQSSHVAARPDLSADVTRLRSLLNDTLADLKALRALLP